MPGAPVSGQFPFTIERTWELSARPVQRNEAAPDSAATEATPFRREVLVFWDEAGGHYRSIVKSVNVYQRKLFAGDDYR